MNRADSSLDLELNQLLEWPKLYLANYFSHLKNEVDKELAKQFILNEHDPTKQEQLNKIWKQMIEKITVFEAECTRNAPKSNQTTDDAAQESSNSLEIRQNDYSENKLLLNKSMLFMNSSQPCSDLLACKLLIINDAHISRRQIEQRFVL